jgi:hypothetical protein
MGENVWREVARFKPKPLCFWERREKSVDRKLCRSLNRLDSEEMKTLDSCHETDSDFPVQPVS